MISPKYFTRLPLAILIGSFTTAFAGAAPVNLQTLTPDTFKSSIATGIWFIEHFSPYCHHCQAFAPTWEKLVEHELSANSPIKLAQVNCAVHGDLCDENKVNGYPQINLYKDGQFIERYKEARDLDLLIAYLAKHTPASPPSPPAPQTTPPPKKPDVLNVNLNPSGMVLNVDEGNFQSVLSDGPVFIKYFAPWCGHCKKLAPIWTQLAKHMQHQVNIAEVNCEDHGGLCSQQGVQGYPMLFFYNNGIKSEYTGGRKFDQLKAFVEKASAPPVQELVISELDQHVKDENVLYLLLHSEGSEGLDEVNREAHALLGSPIIYTSTSKELFGRFRIPIATPWALLAIKDHDAANPASIYTAPTTGRPKVKEWLITNRLPTSIELTQDTFQSVMNAEHKPLVVIAAVTTENKDKVKEKFRDIGARWKARTGAIGTGVVFSWMDAERWASWMSSMYGIKVAEGEDPKIIIANHDKLIYYNKDKQGKPLSLTSTSLFPALESIPKGELTALHSENMVERMARYLNHKLTLIEYYFANYPMQALGFVVAILVVIFYVIKRAAQSEIEDIRTSKSGRLD